MSSKYYARSSNHGFETCAEHLCMTGCLAGAFASQFGFGNAGLMSGLLHDLGKYSDAFQRRIRNPEQVRKVDHSSAGALLAQRHNPYVSMAIAAHHAGLADVGSPRVDDSSTWCGRMSKAWSSNLLEVCDGWQSELRLSDDMWERPRPESSSYTAMMIIRMLLSALVDGDRLDAEFFVKAQQARNEYELLNHLLQTLNTQSLAAGEVPDIARLSEIVDAMVQKLSSANDGSIRDLTGIIERIAQEYFDKNDKSPLDSKRCEILQNCLDRGRDTSCKPGLYTLTAPTGSGKTIASIAFALEHARTHGLQRVIYVIPYTSIIDQTVRKYENMFGAENVLPHYAEASYQLLEESELNALDLHRALATENWNAPIVVTTAVQFFESLYSCKTSRLRKLHNIANSVIVFDEAQTLPVPYLKPCVKAVAELVQHYGASAVLCTATQPALLGLFQDMTGDHQLEIPEIAPMAAKEIKAFTRTTIDVRKERMALDDLADELNQYRQVLCVVNTRKEAQTIYEQWIADSPDDTGYYCLTTLLCPKDRLTLLDDIRDRLSNGDECRVVSTSLIEAGVDVDFPIAYREESGLDSVLQTAGRCNREGHRPVSSSKVTVFTTAEGDVSMLSQNRAAFEYVAERYDDVAAPEAIHEYFRSLLAMKGDSVLDSKGILAAHENGVDGKLMPFETIDKLFRLIDAPTVPVCIPLPDEGEQLCEKLMQGEYSRTLFRKLGQYSINVWPKHLERLLASGKLEDMGADPQHGAAYILRDLSVYDRKRGLSMDVTAGNAYFA